MTKIVIATILLVCYFGVVAIRIFRELRDLKNNPDAILLRTEKDGRRVYQGKSTIFCINFNTDGLGANSLTLFFPVMILVFILWIS